VLPICNDMCYSKKMEIVMKKILLSLVVLMSGMALNASQSSRDDLVLFDGQEGLYQGELTFVGLGDREAVIDCSEIYSSRELMEAFKAAGIVDNVDRRVMTILIGENFSTGLDSLEWTLRQEGDALKGSKLEFIFDGRSTGRNEQPVPSLNHVEGFNPEVIAEAGLEMVKTAKLILGVDSVDLDAAKEAYYRLDKLYKRNYLTSDFADSGRANEALRWAFDVLKSKSELESKIAARLKRIEENDGLDYGY